MLEERTTSKNIFTIGEFYPFLISSYLDTKRDQKEENAIYFFELKHKYEQRLKEVENEKGLKQAFYKTFERHANVLHRDFGILIEPFYLSPSSEEFLSNQDIKDFSSVVKKEKEHVGKRRVGYRLVTQNNESQGISTLFRLQNLKAETQSESRLLQDPKFYLEHIDFEQHVDSTNQSWIDSYDDIMISIGKKHILEIEYSDRKAEKGIASIKVLPMKVRENLYGKYYLFSIKVDQESNKLPRSLNYGNISIIKIERIEGIYKRKSNKIVSVAEIKKLDGLKGEFKAIMDSFVGCIIPDFHPKRFDNPPIVKLKVSNFQLPYINKNKVVEEVNTNDGYTILHYKAYPSFEWIRYVVILSNVWNYNQRVNSKPLHEETAIEVVNDGGTNSAWIRDYLKETYRRALLKYEDDYNIRKGLEKVIMEWEPKTYPFEYDENA